MSKRRQERRGRHESVAGDPAEETLRDLVRQFSDRYAFIRELIQNSLDAAASTIDVEMRHEGGTLTVAVVDDGEGMDRDTIEGYLLTLFRSTKEQDMTKIGKFGIGFVSLFAMEPREVVVDTGRDGVWHRVVFHEDRSYTLLRLDDPFEGSTVTLYVDCAAKEAEEHCRHIRRAAQKWCRFAEAEISTSAEGISQGWGSEPIAAPFALRAPVNVEERGDGFHAVMGIAAKPKVGFYNHGLTLWEATEALIPGVSFRVKGRHLEHTLTRDNVIRDRHFSQVMKRLRAMAEGPLAEACMDAVHQAASDDDSAALERLYGALAEALPWRWDEGRFVAPAVGRGPVNLGELRQRQPSRLLRWTGLSEEAELWWGDPKDPVAQAVAASGKVVLSATDGGAAMLSRLASWTGLRPQSVCEHHRLRRAPAAPHPRWPALAEQAARIAKEAKYSHSFALFDLYGEGADALAQRLPADPLAVERAGEPPARVPRDARIGVNADHPLLRALLDLPPKLAAPLLVRAARLSLGAREPLPPALVLAARDASLEEPE